MAPSDEYGTYDQAKERLDRIVSDVRDADISLEASLDLLDEGVELANRCTELIDVASWSTPSEESAEDEGENDYDDSVAAAPKSMDKD
jgi:exodeoxyribonuclease VII small subunit